VNNNFFLWLYSQILGLGRLRETEPFKVRAVPDVGDPSGGTTFYHLLDGSWRLRACHISSRPLLSLASYLGAAAVLQALFALIAREQLTSFKLCQEIYFY
jgi:hypothetical protein